MREIVEKKNSKVIKSKDEIIREMEAMLVAIIVIVFIFLLIIIYYIGKEQNEQSTYQEQSDISNVIRQRN